MEKREGYVAKARKLLLDEAAEVKRRKILEMEGHGVSLQLEK